MEWTTDSYFYPPSGKKYALQHRALRSLIDKKGGNILRCFDLNLPDYVEPE